MIAKIIAKIRSGVHDPLDIWMYFNEHWGYSNQSLICSLIKSILIDPVLKAKEEKEMAAEAGAVEDAEAKFEAALDKIKNEAAQNPDWMKIKKIIRAEQKRLAQLKNDTPSL